MAVLGDDIIRPENAAKIAASFINQIRKLESVCSNRDDENDMKSEVSHVPDLFKDLNEKIARSKNSTEYNIAIEAYNSNVLLFGYGNSTDLSDNYKIVLNPEPGFNAEPIKYAENVAKFNEAVKNKTYGLGNNHKPGMHKYLRMPKIENITPKVLEYAQNFKFRAPPNSNLVEVDVDSGPERVFGYPDALATRDGKIVIYYKLIYNADEYLRIIEEAGLDEVKVEDPVKFEFRELRGGKKVETYEAYARIARLLMKNYRDDEINPDRAPLHIKGYPLPLRDVIPDQKELIQLIGMNERQAPKNPQTGMHTNFA